MKVYRVAWHVTVAMLAVAGLVSAATDLGWLPVLLVAATMAATGAMWGLAWIGDPRRRAQVVRGLALWFGAGTVFILGLPTLLGPWSVGALAVLPALCPYLVETVLHRIRPDRQPIAADRVCELQPRDLAKRWISTGRQVRDRSTEPSVVLALVEERSLLLDELERRDPVGFEAMLVRAGWHEPQDH